MKKTIFVILTFCIFISCSYAMNIEEKTNEVSKKDWQEYQKYKKDESKKIKVSDKEYEEYQQYLKNKKENNIVSNNIEEKKQNLGNEIIIKGGKILTASSKVELQNSYNGAKIKLEDTDSEGGIIKGDYIRYVTENTGIGLGIAYFSDFVANHLSFLNTDILLKQRFPLEKKNISLYLLGGLGYGYLVGTTKFSDDYFSMEYKGALHWAIAFGVDINSFIIDLSYSCNYISIDTNYSNISGDGSYCSLILSVGYKFSF